MAWSNFILNKGFNLAAGQVVNKFYPVKFSADEEVTPVTAIDDVPAGWAQFGVTAAELLQGKGVSVMMIGITEAVAGAAVAVGNEVQLEATGKVTPVVAASGKRIVGMCVGSPASADGDRISMLIYRGGGLA